MSVKMFFSIIGLAISISSSVRPENAAHHSSVRPIPSKKKRYMSFLIHQGNSEKEVPCQQFGQLLFSAKHFFLRLRFSISFPGEMILMVIIIKARNFNAIKSVLVRFKAAPMVFGSYNVQDRCHNAVPPLFSFSVNARIEFINTPYHVL